MSNICVIGGAGNFQLPMQGDVFTKVRYEELAEPEARSLVEQYNKEASDAGYGAGSPHKRARGTGWDNNKTSRFSDRTDVRGGGGGDRGDRGDRGGGGRYGGEMN